MLESADALDEGVPGRGAQREYERRRKQREDQARAKLGALGVAIIRLQGDPQHVRAWKVGAQGERVVAERLTKHLRDRGVQLLHDRSIPGRRANIDHLAIGPGGVTVIDAKNIEGKVAVERAGGLLGPRTERLLVGGRDRSRLVEGLEGQVAIVRGVLDDLGYQRLDLAAALCFADGAGIPFLSRLSMRGILIEAPRRVADLAARKGGLGPREVQVLGGALARHFPSA